MKYVKKLGKNNFMPKKKIISDQEFESLIKNAYIQTKREKGGLFLRLDDIEPRLPEEAKVDFTCRLLKLEDQFRNVGKSITIAWGRHEEGKKDYKCPSALDPHGNRIYKTIYWDGL